MAHWGDAPIFLIGYRGTGKTSVARELAGHLAYHWVDTDDLIEQMTGKTIAAIFSDEGEAGFREWEARVVTAVIKQVAEFLGNTPAVCRSAYIDPRVIDRFQEGVTVAPAIAALGAGDPLVDAELQGELEGAVIDLLEGKRHSPALSKAA